MTANSHGESIKYIGRLPLAGLAQPNAPHLPPELLKNLGAVMTIVRLDTKEPSPAVVADRPRYSIASRQPASCGRVA